MKMFESKKANVGSVVNGIKGRIDKFRSLATETRNDIKILEGLKKENENVIDEKEKENAAIDCEVSSAMTFVDSIESFCGVKKETGDEV